MSLVRAVPRDASGPSASSLPGLAALGISSQGVSLTYSVSADGLTLSAFAGETLVFTLQLTDLAAGTYQFSLFAPLDHAAPEPGGSDENDLFFLFGYSITDGAGNTALGSLTAVVLILFLSGIITHGVLMGAFPGVTYFIQHLLVGFVFMAVTVFFQIYREYHKLLGRSVLEEPAELEEKLH